MADSKYPLNQILYGPPGTGKTYRTIEEALKILEFETGGKLDHEKIEKKLFGDSVKYKIPQSVQKEINETDESKREEKRRRIYAKALFDHYREQGQIEFVTFHQSYSYEEFVEGIKPKPKGNQVDYPVEDGVFKRICESAKKYLGIQSKQVSNEKSSSMESNTEVQSDTHHENIDRIGLELHVDNLFNRFVKALEERYKEEGNYGTAKLYSGIVHNIGEISQAQFILTNQKYWKKVGNPPSKETLRNKYKEFYESIRDGKPPNPTDLKIGGNTYIWAMLNKMMKFEREEDPELLEYSGQQTPYALSKEQEIQQNPLDKDAPNYILIIDEINRGNLASILGELITLIEPSKRLGNSEELKVVLPYSQGQKSGNGEKELFGVPKNLYIIGTMNTADKNIALMDTALRRRFTFVEMMSKPKELKNLCIRNAKNEDTHISLPKLLRAMNKRIEFLLDRHHTIGHTYFLGLETLEDLRECFTNKIIPLLQEYFYDDYAKIDIVLNGNGMLKNETIEDAMKDGAVAVKDDKKLRKSFNGFVDTDKRIYEITESDEWEAKSFREIYNGEPDKLNDGKRETSDTDREEVSDEVKTSPADEESASPESNTPSTDE
ncbi:hypothetical protein NHP21005_10300 [Helicobacter sp. NHP21005]|uniref:McrB family protein n=1 Tax=Helicobacter felistomachi TaxID=3040201 RepID=UPI0025725425|nr:AAA family ATPase [Helicobacter sp. NHP21005]BEG57342.1 hypothetical protein NHP21005_10300 [Helicobacter sp. NHP21005]